MGEVKKGYKQTDIGVIPEDWELVTLESLTKTFTKQTGFDYTTNIKPFLSIVRNRFFIPFIQNKDFKGKWINYDTDYYIPSNIAKQFTSILLDEKCMLVSISGSIGNLGVFSNTEVAFVGGAVAVLKFKDPTLLDWVMYYLLSKKGQDLLFENVKSGSHQNLTLNDLRKTIITLPCSREQEAIATALSDIDSLIDELTKLIDKKRALKEGAMQQLLSPKEGWVEKTIEGVCIQDGLVRGPFGGTLKKEIFVTKGYKVYEQRNAIYQNFTSGNYFITRSKFQELRRFEIKENDYIISCSGTIGRIYKIPQNAPKGIINQALLKITIDKFKIYPDYFYYYFSWAHFQNEIIDNTQGGALKNLVGMPIFRKTKIYCPNNILEQQQIATTLSDMDTEIVALEENLSKYKAIKIGMMQQLLAGQIRLV